MHITRATDYAVRVMIHLAGLPPGSSLRMSELSKATDVSGHFLSKVLQQLVRSGLIHSQRGSGGGYILAVSPASVSLLDVVQAMEGPVKLNQCVGEGPSCNRKAGCPVHHVWAEAQVALANVLRKASLLGLVREASTRPQPPYRARKPDPDRAKFRGDARVNTQPERSEH